MENCLIIKLKSAVQNSDLDVLGLIKVHYKASATPNTTNRYLGLGLRQGTPGKVTIFGGNFVQSDLTTVIGTEVTFDTSASNVYQELYISNNECDIYIPKYGIYFLVMCNDNYVVQDTLPTIKDWSWLEYGDIFMGNFYGLCDKTLDLSILSRHNPSAFCTRTICSGHLSDLANCTNFINLMLMNTDDTYDGNIAALGNLVNLVFLILNGSNISGTIEGLAEAQIAAGRTTGDISCNFGNTRNITYEGNPVSGAVITFSGGSYTVTNVTP